MIDTSKIEFSERTTEYPDVKMVSGTLEMHAGFMVDRGRNVPSKEIQHFIRIEIWNAAYGDLIPHFFELIATGEIFVPRTHSEHWDKCVEKINKLLTPPQRPE